MMEQILDRAEAAARIAQRQRLEQIAAALEGHGISAQVESNQVSWRGRRIVRQWLGDPLLRCIGRAGE